MTLATNTAYQIGAPQHVEAAQQGVLELPTQTAPLPLGRWEYVSQAGNVRLLVDMNEEDYRLVFPDNREPHEMTEMVLLATSLGLELMTEDEGAFPERNPATGLTTMWLAEVLPIEVVA